ncbi:MAG: tyrosine-type recombinase/integrase [Streptomycetaceae bacterium]|nr:tyrosine-type recombinase/integrase [Streptomycetaceae bacterium]
MSPAKATAKSRRAYGDGGIWYDEKRARYVGTIEAGWNGSGSRRRITRTGKTKLIVQRKLREAHADAAARQAPIAGGKPSVKVWAEQWLEDTRRLRRPTTWQANRSQVNTWIIPTIGHRRLEALRPADVRAVERAMEAKGRKPSTIARCRAVLDKMLKDAAIEGHTIPQGVLLVEGVGAGENDRDAIPLPDALALLEAAAAQPDSSRWVAALLQGMRPAEVRGLTWSAVDLDSDLIDISWQLKPLPYKVARDRSSGFVVPRNYVAKQVQGTLHLVRPKTESGRRLIPLVSWMREALLAWRELCPPSKAGFVWPDPDGSPRDDKDDRAAWVRLQDAAQVAHVEGELGRRYTLYEARHTTATLLREAGVDDETITAIMGHATILSTKAYLHTNKTKVRAALDEVASRLQLGA